MGFQKSLFVVYGGLENANFWYMGSQKISFLYVLVSKICKILPLSPFLNVLALLHTLFLLEMQILHFKYCCRVCLLLFLLSVVVIVWRIFTVCLRA